MRPLLKVSLLGQEKLLNLMINNSVGSPPIYLFFFPLVLFPLQHTGRKARGHCSITRTHTRTHKLPLLRVMKLNVKRSLYCWRSFFSSCSAINLLTAKEAQLNVSLVCIIPTVLHLEKRRAKKKKKRWGGGTDSCGLRSLSTPPPPPARVTQSIF